MFLPGQDGRETDFFRKPVFLPVFDIGLEKILPDRIYERITQNTPFLESSSKSG
jgi:hypothetical protein